MDGQCQNHYQLTILKWMSKKELKELNIDEFETNQEIAYMLEVDLEYPHELHDLHNDYPLAPGKNNSK